MSEKALWSTPHGGMNGRWHGQRHEDKLSLGIPDVSFGLRDPDIPQGSPGWEFGVNGWMELKYLQKFTKGDIKIPHFTNHQRNWLTSRGRHGGNCWILIQIATTYMLYDWPYARTLGHMTETCMRKTATAVWEDDIDFEKLHRILARFG